MTKITPFLWFEDEAEEAVDFYLNVFKNSKKLSEMPGPDDKPMTIEFELDGTRFTALNGGEEDFTFNESISFVIDCDNQEEVDHYWNALASDGGEEGECGWLKDKYGLSWQVVPKQLMQALTNPNPEKAQHAMQAMLKMNKIIIADL